MVRSDSNSILYLVRCYTTDRKRFLNTLKKPVSIMPNMVIVCRNPMTAYSLKPSFFS